MTRVLIARHGAATYVRPELISNDGGWLTEEGRDQSRRLGRRLRPEGPSVVVTSTMARAVETGELVAEELGLTARAVDGLQEFDVGLYAGQPDGNADLQAVYDAWFAGDLDRRVPGAQSGRELVARFGSAIDALVEGARGDVVVAVSHGGVMSVAVPHRCVNVSDAVARRHFLANGVVVPVDVDRTGTWTLVGEWPGRAEG